MNSEAHIVEIGQIAAPAGEIRYLLLPDSDLFSRRAERFRHLSRGHSMGEYLGFLALLADAQHTAMKRFPTQPLPAPKEQALCREHGIPLLAARSWIRNPAWRTGLTMILQQIGESPLPVPACKTIAGLLYAKEIRLEKMADSILAGNLNDVSPQELPLVSAALQVYWVQMASALEEPSVGRLDQGGVCPVCGSRPIAGIIHNGGEKHGLRYLCCSLCDSQWHMVRLKCSSCESTHGINHYTLEGSNGAVKAESCDNCNSYLKLLYLEKDRRMDPIADDLATLVLDMLMEKESKTRGGPNLLFHSGRN